MNLNNQFFEQYGQYADQNVFEIFSFHFLAGNPKHALVDPSSIVLSESIAKKLFPGRDALGKQVIIEKKFPLTVSGVYSDLPDISSFRPSYLTSMSAFTTITGWKDYNNNWWTYGFNSYVLLYPNSNSSTVDHRIEKSMKDYNKNHYPYIRALSKIHVSPYFEKNYYVSLSIIAFADLLILIPAIVTLVAMVTISYKILKSARINPTEALKYE